MPTTRRGTWTDEQCNAALREWHQQSLENDLPLNATSYGRWRAEPRNHHHPPTNAVAPNAQLFADACDAIGLAITQRGRPQGRTRRRFTRLQRIEAIRQCANDLGRSPSLSDYRRWYSKTQVSPFVPSGRLFTLTESYERDCELAGIEPGDDTTRPSPRYSYDQIKDDMAAALAQAGGVRPSRSQWDKFRQESSHPVIAHQNLEYRTGARWASLWATFIESDELPVRND